MKRRNIKLLLLLFFICILGIATFYYFYSLNQNNEQAFEKSVSKINAYEDILKYTNNNETKSKLWEDDTYNHPEKIDEKPPLVDNVVVEPKSQLWQPKVIDSLLPLSNSAIRSEADDITHIVIHFASNVIAKPNNPHIPEDIKNIFKRYGVSAHYLIARDGTIFRLVDENRIAFHAGRGSLADFPQYTNRLNRHSIGVEILAIGSEEEMRQYISPEIYRSIPQNHIGYTQEQYMALNFLLPRIYERHSIKADRRYVIGHDEYAVGRKRDPGILFDWSKIGF